MLGNEIEAGDWSFFFSFVNVFIPDKGGKVKKIAWIALCVVACSSLLFSQTITVTKPVANETLFKGDSYLITWTKSGSMADEVRIALVNEAANSVVLDIALKTLNDGRHLWSIPLNAPSGRFKIAIRTIGSKITGLSPTFNLQMRRAGTRTPPPPDKRSVDYNVTISKPDSRSRWNFGDVKDILIETDFEAVYFWMDLTKGGQQVFPIHEGPIRPYAKEGNIHKYRLRWTIPTQSTEAGNYRVRVKAAADQGDVQGMSASFYLSEATTREITTSILEPSLLRNRRSQKREKSGPNVKFPARQEPQWGPNRPGFARIGFENTYVEYDYGWRYWGFIFRSQIVFPIEQLMDKKGLLLEAKLLLTHDDTVRGGIPNPMCASKLYTLTAPWTGSARETPGYFYKDLPTNQKSIEIDILQQLRDWLEGREENHGLLITGINENFDHDNKYCISYYKVSLKVKYYETVN